MSAAPTRGRRERGSVGPLGCRYGHGADRVYRTPDGLRVCRACANYAVVLRRARAVLPELPELHEFVAEHGFGAVERLRLAMRLPPSGARRPDGSYAYARPSRVPLDELLSRGTLAASAVPAWEAVP